MRPRRVARSVEVRGLGVVSPLGVGVGELWRRLAAGECALAESPRSSRGIAVPRRAATVDPSAEALVRLAEERALRRVARLSLHAVAAARMAAPEARPLLAADDTAVVLGTCYGASRYHFDYYEGLFRGGLREASPLLFSECVTNAAPGHVALSLGLRGASLALVGGEEVGLTAVVEAAERVRLGDARAAFAGGAEEYCDFVHAALAARGFVGEEAAAPYSGGDGAPFLGEGAALLYLEEPGTGAAEREPPLARLLGWGAARGGPEGIPGAVERAVGEALEDAGVRAEEIDVVVGSACGSALDAAEAEGLARALRRGRGEPVAVTCPKAALGEGFAFTSGAQALVAVEALRSGCVPATANASRGGGAGAEPRLLPPGFTLARAALACELRCALAVAANRRGAAVAGVFGAT